MYHAHKCYMATIIGILTFVNMMKSKQFMRELESKKKKISILGFMSS